MSLASIVKVKNCDLVEIWRRVSSRLVTADRDDKGARRRMCVWESVMLLICLTAVHLTEGKAALPLVNMAI